MNKSFKSWTISAILLFALLIFSDYFFLHFLFEKKRQAAEKSFNKEVNQALEKCEEKNEAGLLNSSTCKFDLQHGEKNQAPETNTDANKSENVNTK